MNESPQQTDQLLEDIQIDKYLKILSRKKWWIIITTTAILVTTVVVALRLPDLYHAQTVILVDPQKVPDSYVPSTGSTTVADRLSTVRQEVMSPTRLKQLLDNSGMYSKEIAEGREDAIIQKLQKSIQLDVVDAGGSRLSAFQIGFTSTSPEAAALIPNKLANMVIQNNVEAGVEHSTDTAEFLETELQKTKKELEQKESEMGRIKSTYIMDLPESKQFHLEALTTLRNQLQASQDRVSRDQQEKVYLQASLEGSNTTVDLDADAPGALSSPEQSQLEKLETHLSELRGRYGPSHPDVRKAESEIKQLKDKIAVEQKSVPTPVAVPRPTHRTSSNPVVTAQITKLDQDIDDQTKLQKPMEEQIAFHSSKLEREPVFEEQIAGLMRDYDTLREHYNHLLDKKLSADMYTSLVTHEQGERFEVLDPAVVPTKPFGPNRFLYGLIALLGGLLAGAAFAFVAEMADPSVRNEQEATEILGKACLVGIPSIVTSRQTRSLRIRAIGAVAVTVVSASIVGFVISYVIGLMA
ncbi:MAG: Wzz/FepE/Etk N-terminal domain-containing protein [Candidatus Acidiferrum sp.]|jgi:succinoglycan biosynthesis transport protein ExoP